MVRDVQQYTPTPNPSWLLSLQVLAAAAAYVTLGPDLDDVLAEP